MSKGNVYKYDNLEFSSLKQLAKYVGIHEKTLTARLRRGMSIEEACEKKDLRCSYHNYDANEQSIAEICRESGKDVELVRNRLVYGYSLHDALNKPKKISRQGKPISVNGILYNSVSDALRKLGIPEKEGIVRGRLNRGYSPEDAFKF